MSGRNYSIDILKFVCACLIVFIHTIDWQFYQEFLPLTRCAVPCFFIISGYLLFDKEQGRIIPERLKRNIIHIGKILLWTTLFYLVFDEIVYCLDRIVIAIGCSSESHIVKMDSGNTFYFGIAFCK